MGDPGRRGRHPLSTTPAPTPAPDRERRRAGGVPALVLLVVLVAAAAYLVRLDAKLWFFGDEWDFLLRRGTVPGADLGLWRPHNEHWSTLPILLWRGLFAVWGLGSYTPYVVPVALAHVAAAGLVALACRRAGTAPWACVAVGAVLALLGAGAENLTWAFQIGFVGSVCLGWAAVVAVSLAERRAGRARAGWCAVAAALVLGSFMCSGVGITMAVLVALHALLRLGLCSTLATLAVPGALFLLWYVALGRHAHRAAPPVTAQEYRQVPEFVWTGLGGAMDRLLGLPGDSATPGGLVLVAVVVGVLVLARRRPREAQLALAGVVAALVQLLLSGVTRVSLGVGQAAVSRYVYLTCFLVLPAVAVVVGALLEAASRRRTGAVGALVVLAVATAYVGGTGVAQLRSWYAGVHARSDQQRALMVAAVDLVRSGAPLLEPKLPDPSYDPDVRLDLLMSAPVQASFPTTPLTEQGRLDASSTLQVAVVTGSPLVPASGWSVLEGGAGTPVDGQPGCTRYDVATGEALTVLARTPAREAAASGAAGLTGQALRVTTTGSTVVTRLVASSGLRSTPSTRPSRPGTPQWVETVSSTGSLLVRVDDPGPVLVCGARPTGPGGAAG